MTITRPVPSDAIVDAAAVKGGAAAASPTVWTCTGDITQIAQPWVTALGELKEVTRTKNVNAGPIRYSYAELGDVLSLARTVLATHDLAVFQVATVEAGEIAVATTVMHVSGVFLSFAPFTLPAGVTAQSTGSAATYARRYSLMSILGLATEDDDGATAGTRDSKPKLSAENVQRFLDAATDALLTHEETAQVVLDATRGRTPDPRHVYVSEVPALREALHKYSADDAGEQYSPVSSKSVEGDALLQPADPSTDPSDE